MARSDWWIFNTLLVCLSSFLLIFNFLCPVLFKLPFFSLSSSLSLFCTSVALCLSFSELFFLHFSAPFLFGIVSLRYGFSLSPPPPRSSLFFVAKIICRVYWVFSFLLWVFGILSFFFVSWVPWWIALRLGYVAPLFHFSLHV